MTNVTDLPSGQRLVWPLQIFTRSATPSAETELPLLETIARSRAAAKETPTVAMNKEIDKALGQNTLAPANKIRTLRDSRGIWACAQRSGRPCTSGANRNQSIGICETISFQGEPGQGCMSSKMTVDSGLLRLGWQESDQWGRLGLLKTHIVQSDYQEGLIR